MTNNPLLETNELMPFDRIKPEHIDSALDVLLENAYAAFATVTDTSFVANWTEIDRVFGVAAEKVSAVWGAISHLNSVADTPELREKYNKNMTRITEYSVMVGSSKELFAKYNAIDSTTLNEEQRRAHTLAIRGFVMGGAELEGAAKERFAEIQDKMSTLGQKFSENTLDATDAFSYYATLEELEGVPVDVVSVARSAAQKDDKEGYKLSLKMPCYLPIMQFAKSTELREKLYRATATRASDMASIDNIKFDNGPIIREIMPLRQEEASILGYNNYAELSLVPKMAETPEEVTKFLRNFAVRAKPFAEQDLANLKAHATTLGIENPQPWDWTYISEKLKEEKYSYSEQEVKEYFPITKVLDGLFNIAESLFEITIKPDTAPVWHPSVQFFRIERDDQLVGQFYLDPIARTGKRSGAWMNNVRARELRVDTGKLQTPIAYLVCNFSDGVDGNPSLLTHDDVITLFHEFGHGLHHMLTKVTEGSISGINNVEWDAVELPSQFMENFCWEWSVITNMTEHVSTGSPLPRDLFDKMLAAKNFQVGLGTVRQMEMSLFDMILHMGIDDYMDVQKAVRNEVAVMKSPEWARTINTFSHIFSGGYAAGYYSYKWAEVLSADAYAAFEETGSDIQTSRRFRTEILEKGSSRPIMDSFIAFRGRKPSVDALLRHSGMIENDET